MLCALVVRGIVSILKAEIRRSAKRSAIAGSPKGLRKLISTDPSRNSSISERPSSRSCGIPTLSRMSASRHKAEVSEIIFAPAAS